MSGKSQATFKNQCKKLFFREESRYGYLVAEKTLLIIEVPSFSSKENKMLGTFM